MLYLRPGLYIHRLTVIGSLRILSILGFPIGFRRIIVLIDVRTLPDGRRRMDLGHIHAKCAAGRYPGTAGYTSRYRSEIFPGISQHIDALFAIDDGIRPDFSCGIELFHRSCHRCPYTDTAADSCTGECHNSRIRIICLDNDLALLGISPGAVTDTGLYGAVHKVYIKGSRHSDRTCTASRNPRIDCRMDRICQHLDIFLCNDLAVVFRYRRILAMVDYSTAAHRVGPGAAHRAAQAAISILIMSADQHLLRCSTGNSFILVDFCSRADGGLNIVRGIRHTDGSHDGSGASAAGCGTDGAQRMGTAGRYSQAMYCLPGQRIRYGSRHIGELRLLHGSCRSLAVLALILLIIYILIILVGEYALDGLTYGFTLRVACIGSDAILLPLGINSCVTGDFCRHILVHDTHTQCTADSCRTGTSSRASQEVHFAVIHSGHRCGIRCLYRAPSYSGLRVLIEHMHVAGCAHTRGSASSTCCAQGIYCCIGQCCHLHIIAGSQRCIITHQGTGLVGHDFGAHPQTDSGGTAHAQSAGEIIHNSGMLCRSRYTIRSGFNGCGLLFAIRINSTIGADGNPGLFRIHSNCQYSGYTRG